MAARSIALALALIAGLTTAGCHSKAPKAAANTLDAMDSELVNGSATDENARKALAGTIQVDPARAGKAPQAGDRKATVSLADAATRQSRHEPIRPAGEDDVTADGGIAQGCLGGLAYTNTWATKLPADMPMHPAATLEEAAGHDGGCQIRVVSFTVPGDREAVLNWYEAKAKAAGYSAARSGNDGDRTLQGGRGDDAFIIMAGAAKGGATPVDYIWTHGG